jgi:RimJ/RimL family protein N-acetyltransferase
MAEAVTSNALATHGAPRILPFDPRYGEAVARWVGTREELLHLAPATEPPLTAAKVVAWVKPGGQAYLLWREDDEEPVGYAELNPMRGDPKHFWLGHVIIRPDQRGRGLGCSFVKQLLSNVFGRLSAERLSLVVFPRNKSAIECYLRAGFAEVGEESHQFNGRGPRHNLLRLEARRPSQ